MISEDLCTRSSSSTGPNSSDGFAFRKCKHGFTAVRELPGEPVLGEPVAKDPDGSFWHALAQRFYSIIHFISVHLLIFATDLNAEKDLCMSTKNDVVTRLDMIYVLIVI